MSNTTYFGFAIADSMFPQNCSIMRKPLNTEEFVCFLRSGVVSCCNGSHQATVDVLNQILKPFAVHVDIPQSPPQVKLEKSGDSIVVLSVRGLPRLTDNRHYTQEEIASATFVYGLWELE